jgi:predicted MFS family arabinose efflux permease
MVSASAEALNGSMYVIDQGSERIVKINSDRQVKHTLETGRGAEFSYVRDITVRRTSFFVLDLEWNADGMSIHSERILKFDAPSGDFIKVVAEHTYDERKSIPRLNGLTTVNEEVRYAFTGRDGFEIYSIDTSGVAHLIYAADYQNAIIAIQDFAITENEVYVLDKTGRITRFCFDGGETRDIFVAESGETVEEFVLPLSISADTFGNIFFADIGQRSINRITPEGEVSEIFATDDEHCERFIFFSVKVLNDSLVFTDDLTVYHMVGEDVEFIDSVDLSTGLMLYYLALWAATVLLIISALIFVIKTAIAVLKTKKRDSKQQMTFAIVLTAILVSVSIVSSVMSALDTESRDEMINRLSTLAVLSRDILDTDALNNLNSPQDFGSDDYNSLINSLKRLSSSEHDWNSNLYCLVYKFDEDNVYTVARLDESMGAFYTYGEQYDGSAVQEVVDSGGELVVEKDIVDISGSYMAVIGPVYNHDGDIIAAVEIGICLGAFDEKMSLLFQGIIVGGILIIAILIFLMIEGVDILFTLANRRKIRASFDKVLLPIPYIRVLTFVIFIAFNLTTGFLPIYAGRFYADLWGVSPEITAAVPLVANQILIAFSALICGAIVKLAGIRNVFAAGALFCVGGEVVNAVASSFEMFMAGMCISGFGAGLVFSCINIYIGSLENVEHKTDGFTFFNAASFAGMNSGVLMGAALAVMVGQAHVFYISAAVWFVALVAFIMLINKKVPKPVISGQKQIGLMKFLFSRSVFVTLLMLFNYVVLNGFLYYFVPVFGELNGMAETEISLLFIIHTVAVVFFGPAIMKRLKGTASRTIILFAVALSVASLLLVAYDTQILYVVLAVFVLGCSNSIGMTYFPLYFSELDKTKKLGTEKAMPVYGGADNLGSAAAPAVFGVAIASGLAVGFAAISAVTGGVMVLFALLTGRSGKSEQKIREGDET